ncbi:MAG TPA: hypothetical protein DCE71_06955 [Parachlamydiales bacterium]|nr:hypothetical protein [Parachlamydiales bacterium]
MRLLIDILLDKTAREDERSDAAIDLRMYYDLEALNALAKIASDPSEDDLILDNCAESIGEICIGMNYFSEDLFRKMTTFAQRIVFNSIVCRNPEILDERLRNELGKKFGE